MRTFFKCLLYIVLVLLFCLSGRSYFYAPSVHLRLESDVDFCSTFYVYYTTNEYEDFSELKVCCGMANTKDKFIDVFLPTETLKKLLIVPYDWSKRGTHGRYISASRPQGKETYSVFNPKLIDGEGHEISANEIYFIESGVKKDSSIPCVLSDGAGGTSALYELANQTTFAKQFSSSHFISVAVWSALCAWLVLFAITVEPFEKDSKKKHLLYAFLSAIALSANFTIIPLVAFSQNFTLTAYLAQAWRDCDFLHLAMILPLYLLYRKAGLILVSKEERRSQTAKALAVILSAFIIIGKAYETIGSADLLFGFEFAQSIKTAIVFFGLVLFVYTLCLLLFRMMDASFCKVFLEYSTEPSSKEGIAQRYFSALQNRPFMTAFCSLLLFYVPFLILKWPCSMAVDGYFQAIQIHGGETLHGVPYTPENKWNSVLTAHHPVAHTFLILALLKCGLWVGNVYVGLFLYSCIQLLFVIAAVAGSIGVLVKYAHVNARIAGIVIAYYALHPFVNDYMFLVTKDVIYSAAILLYLSTLFAYQSANDEESKEPHVCRGILSIMIAAAMGVCLFRNEGPLLISASSFVVLIFRRKGIKPFLVSLVVAVASMVAVNGVIRTFDVEPGKKKEMYSVPCQQLARALREHSELFTQEEKQEVRDIFAGEDIAYLYSTGTSDPVKHWFNENGEEDYTKRLFSLWAKGLFRCPQTYAEAFLHNYYFYIFPDYRVADCQSGVSTLSVNLASRLGCPKGASYMLAAQKIISSYIKVRNQVMSFPLLILPMIAATYTWLICILAAYAASRRCKAALILLVFPIFLTFMPFLGPTNGDFGRYSFPLMVCLPFVSLAVLRMVKDKLDNNNG